MQIQTVHDHYRGWLPVSVNSQVHDKSGGVLRRVVEVTSHHIRVGGESDWAIYPLREYGLSWELAWKPGTVLQ